MKRIVLCVDDYGQAPAISRAILTLIEKNRLSAVSCLSNFKDWPLMAQALKKVRNQVEVGLHFNLTEGPVLSAAWHQAAGARFRGLIPVLIKSYLHKLPTATIQAEFEAQLAAFETYLGPPDFIDGHQHIQQLPQISDMLLQVHAKLPSCYYRMACPRLYGLDRTIFKRVGIALLGGMTFKNKLSRQLIPHNKSFAGIYDFSQAQHYRKYFQNFLKNSPDGTLIMCHPGGPAENDSIEKARVAEYQYFVSDLFLNDCETFQIELVKGKTIFF